MESSSFEMIAKTLSGLEEVLAQELANIGASEINIGNRMVSFTGDKALLYRANMECRTAIRVLKPIVRFEAQTPDEIYEHLSTLAWEDLISTSQTFVVDSVVYSENFNHSKFVAYRVKDAIADYFTKKYEKRPSVSVQHPDIYFHIHISHQQCTLCLDSSGESLHKRGWRTDSADSALNAVMAAGLVLLCGWDKKAPLIDVMCGTGTILIEAALIACNIAPGIYRKHFAFEQWKDFDKELFEEIYNDDVKEIDPEIKLYGSDSSARATSMAIENIKNAGLSKYIEIQTLSVQQLEKAPAPNGIVITNPPYGGKIKPSEAYAIFEILGERLKHLFQGYNAWILGYKEDCFQKIGFKPAQKIRLINDSEECDFRLYEIFKGKYNDFKKEQSDRPLEKEFKSPRQERYQSLSTYSTKEDEEEGQQTYSRISTYSHEKGGQTFNRFAKKNPSTYERKLGEPTRRTPFDEEKQRPYRPQEERSDFRREGRPSFRKEGQSDFKREGRSDFRRDGQSDFRKEGRPSFRKDGQSDFKREGRSDFKRDGQSDFRKEGRPSFRKDGQSDFKREGRSDFRRDGQSDFRRGDSDKKRSFGASQDKRSFGSGKPSFNSKFKSQGKSDFSTGRPFKNKTRS